MRKIIVYEFLTMDGVMQAPGGPEEDTTGGFQYGGWTAPFGHEAADEILRRFWYQLFDEEAMPATYKVSETFVTPSDVIMVNYQRSGPVETGTVGESS